MARPYRAQTHHHSIPRALPWAGMAARLQRFRRTLLLHRSFSRAPGWGRTYRNETCRRGSHSDPAGRQRIAWRAALSKTVSLSNRRSRRGADAAAPSNARSPPWQTPGGMGNAWCHTRLRQVSYKQDPRLVPDLTARELRCPGRGFCHSSWVFGHSTFCGSHTSKPLRS